LGGIQPGQTKSAGNAVGDSGIDADTEVGDRWSFLKGVTVPEGIGSPLPETGCVEVSGLSLRRVVHMLCRVTVELLRRTSKRVKEEVDKILLSVVVHSVRRSF
jgi:hypothetical protein